MKKLLVPIAVLCLLLCSCRSGKTDHSAADTPAPAVDALFDDDTPLAGNTDSSAAGTGSFSLSSFTGGEDAPADTLHDPGPLLDAEARQADDEVIDGVTYRVYVYDFDDASSIKLNFYSSALEKDGYSIEKTDADGDTALYAITGPDGVAVLRVYNPLLGSSPSWTLYVPTDMAFTPNQDSSASGGISGSSFQNDSFLSGSSSITGGSFQNDSFLAGAKDPIVVDGMLICTQCNGTGVCPYCHGSGTVKYDLHTRDTCVACDGSGICDVCDGTGNWGPA